MEVNILAAKSLSCNPADGIDNFTLAVFSRISPNKIKFYSKVSQNFAEIGSIKRLEISKLVFLIWNKPDYLWGIGNIKELLFLLFKPSKTKYVINFHTILIKNNGPWQVKTPWFLRKFIFSRADLIICPSKFSAQSVKKYFPNKKVINILNGVDLDLFNFGKKDEKYLENKYSIDFSKPLAVFIGTFVPRKRPDIFIELAKILPNINFVAVGKNFEQYNFLISAHGLKNFQWLERLSRADIAILLASAKIFIFPSLNEPSAAVILEAMASGAIPVISRSGGNPEFLNNGQEGFLIDPNKDEILNFSDNIKMLVSDENLYWKISKACRLRAEKQSWEVVARQYEDCLT